MTVYHCQARLRSKGGLRCGKEGATPRFTKRLRDMGPSDTQPKYIGPCHNAKFPGVFPSTGKPYVDHTDVKSFMLLADGSMKPLPAKDQYAPYWARRMSGQEVA